VQQNLAALQFVSEKLLADKDFVVQVVRGSGLALRWLGERWNKDTEIVSNMISKGRGNDGKLGTMREIEGNEGKK
jgi:hypothetical protein